MGKASPFCLAWFADMAAGLMFSIEHILCGIMWLPAVVHDKLRYKRIFLQFSSSSFEQSFPLCFQVCNVET